VLIIVGFVVLLAIPPVARIIRNKWHNKSNVVVWGSDALRYKDRTLRYSDVATVGFQLRFEKSYANNIKYDDAVLYLFNINDIKIKRRHSTHARIMAKGKRIAEEIVYEYEEIASNIYTYLLPVLLEKSTRKLQETGSVELGGATVMINGELRYKGKTYVLADVSIEILEGDVVFWSNSKTTFLGDRKELFSIPLSADNAFILEPITRGFINPGAAVIAY
jgi:hypothetical protein